MNYRSWCARASETRTRAAKATFPVTRARGNICNRHSNDAAVPSPYLTRLGTQSCAKIYGLFLGDELLPTQRTHSDMESLRGRLSGWPRATETGKNGNTWDKWEKLL